MDRPRLNPNYHQTGGLFASGQSSKFECSLLSLSKANAVNLGVGYACELNAVVAILADGNTPSVLLPSGY